MQQPPIRLLETVLPVDSLPQGQVTLLGDSAHSMVRQKNCQDIVKQLIKLLQVPFRGMGANTALTDACALARGIVKGIKDGREIDDMLRTYEKNMIPNGRSKVLASRETAESTESSDVSGGRVG